MVKFKGGRGQRKTMVGLEAIGLALLTVSVAVTGAVAAERSAKPNAATERAAITVPGGGGAAMRQENAPGVGARTDRLPAMRDERALLQFEPPHRLTVGRDHVVAKAGETRLSIKVESRDGMPAGSYVLVNGMPAGAMLSRGIAIGPELWLVDATEVDRLTLGFRAGQPLQFTDASDGHSATAPFALGLRWVTVEGYLLAQDKLTVDVPSTELVSSEPPLQAIELPRAFDEPTQPDIARSFGHVSKPAASRTAEPSRGAGPAKTDTPVNGKTIDTTMIDSSLTRGRRMLEIGNFAVGRPLLERAAASGSAAAALMIANSFDPDWLHQTGAVGATPDTSKARTWYELALRLGATEAVKHLARLAQN